MSSNSRQAFDLQVDAWVAGAVQDGTANFGDLLSNLPGVFPTEVLASLERLKQSNRVGALLASRMERQARSAPSLQPFSKNALLPPHPLDFEWRFSRATGRELVSRAVSLSGPNESVLLLGTPTLALLAAKEPRRSSFYYVGEDNAITQQVRSITGRSPSPPEIRLCGPDALLPNEAAVVLLDPPWYFDFLRAMLRAAAFACCPGGHVLVSLPPMGTNTHVAADRTRILQLLAKLSLNLVSVERGAVQYDTPYFEANVLASMGYSNIPRAWRRGDLFVLEKNHSGSEISFTNRARPREWDEIVIGRMRLFVTRKPVKAQSNEEWFSLVPGDILQSVKRGDPRRQKAQVWTSGNRIFGSTRPDLVRLAAHFAANGGSPRAENRLSERERDTVKRLSYFLGELAITEESEERSGRFEEENCPIAPSISGSASSRTTSRRTRSGANT